MKIIWLSMTNSEIVEVSSNLESESIKRHEALQGIH